MEKVFGRTFMKTWTVMKPWLITGALLLLLRYTGTLSRISYLTGSALMRTGFMDATPHEPAVARKFNYNFKIKDLKGNVIEVNSIKNKIVFLNLWATWCGPCRMEMPSIQSLYNQVDTSKIVFVMLSMDRNQDLEKVKTYVTDNGYTFPVYTPASSLPNQLHVTSIPTTFIISPDGKVVSTKSGAANYDTRDFKEFLESMLLP